MDKKSPIKYMILCDVLDIGYSGVFFSIYGDLKTRHKSQIEKMKFKA